MQVGVYVDGYNLYYGGRAWCGRGKAGWRWLDIRQMVQAVIDREAGWSAAQIDRLVYCTARIDARTNPSGQADQDVYLKALLTSGTADYIEYGKYVARTRAAPLAVKDGRGRPVVVNADWPVMVQDAASRPVVGASFLASVLNTEERDRM
jgi:hypothetical protein